MLRRSGPVEDSAEQGIKRIAFVAEDQAVLCGLPLGEFHESSQDRRLGRKSGWIETECPGCALTSPVEIGQIIPVLVGDRLEFLRCSPGSIPPPRCHETQPYKLRQPERNRAGFAVEAYVHHRAFLAALADETERVS